MVLQQATQLTLLRTNSSGVWDIWQRSQQRILFSHCVDPHLWLHLTLRISLSVHNSVVTRQHPDVRAPYVQVSYMMIQQMSGCTLLVGLQTTVERSLADQWRVSCVAQAGPDHQSSRVPFADDYWHADGELSQQGRRSAGQVCQRLALPGALTNHDQINR